MTDLSPLPDVGRRHVIITLAATIGSQVFSGPAAAMQRPESLQISCQQVPWAIYFRREEKRFDMDEALAGAAAAGLTAFEPIINSPSQLSSIATRMKEKGLALRSLYVEGTLHDEALAEECFQKLTAIAPAAKMAGTKIILVRPNPLSNGREVPKSDDQLTIQARQLDRLGGLLKDHGLQLAWPNHDIELMHSAREFHHMMTGTDPVRVGLCLDVQWAHRGTGNSQVALFDLVRLYRQRLVELHLRQTRDGVFTEAFGEGDIDYPRLRKLLKDVDGPQLHLVLDQAPEKGTPKTMSPVEAHRAGREYITQLFGA